MQQNVSNIKPQNTLIDWERTIRRAALATLPAVLMKLDAKARAGLYLRLTALLVALTDPERAEFARNLFERHAYELGNDPLAVALYEMAFTAATGSTPVLAVSDLRAAPWEPEFIAFAAAGLARAFTLADNTEQPRSAIELLRAAGGAAVAAGDASGLTYAVCNALHDGESAGSWQMALVATELVKVAARPTATDVDTPSLEALTQVRDTCALAAEILGGYLAAKGGA